MTRFDADTPEKRRALIVDAIDAHRERESVFLTLEADPSNGEETPPWVQLADDTLNLDCTDGELERLKALLDEFTSFTVDDLVRPDEAEGTNVRVLARTDDERIAEFVDAVFRRAYDRPESYRLWVTDV